MTLGDLVVKITGDNSSLDSSIDKSESKLKKFSDTALKAGKSLTTFVSAPIIAIGVAAVKSAGQMEMYQAAFETMLGSATKATALLKDMKAFAAQTSFNFPDFADAAKTLLQFGVTGDDVLPIMKNLGDVAQGNNERFSQLALVYGQVQSTGHLMGQDLLQLINAGFNPLQEISRTTGQTMVQLKDAMSKGAISADMVTKAFESATSQGGAFYDGMKKASQTLPGLWSTMTDNIAQAGRSLAQVVLPVVKDMTKTITDLAAKINGMSDESKRFIVIAAGLAAAVGPVILGVSALTKAIIAARTAITLLTANPTILAITALAAGLVAVGVAFKKAIDKASAGYVSDIADEFTRTVIATDAATTSLKLYNLEIGKNVTVTGEAKARMDAFIASVEGQAQAATEAAKVTQLTADQQKRLNEITKSITTDTRTQIETYQDEIDELAGIRAGVEKNSEAYDALQPIIRKLVALRDQEYGNFQRIRDADIDEYYKKLAAATNTAADATDELVLHEDQYATQHNDLVSQMSQSEWDLSQTVKSAQDEIDKARQDEHDKEVARQQELYNTAVATTHALVNSVSGAVNAFFDYKLSLYDKDSQEYKKVAIEQFNAQKAISAINAGIAGAEAAVKAYQALAGIPYVGPALAAAAAVAIGAFTAGEVAFILAQQAPKLAQGGIAMPRPGGYPAIIGDNPTSPELVLPLDQLESVISRVSLLHATGGGEQSIRNVITLDGKVIADYVTQGTNDRSILIHSGAVVN